MEKVLNFKIQDELYKRVKQKSVELNISMGALARMALSEYLSNNKKENEQ